LKEDYALEYGTDRLEVHSDAIEPGQVVLIVDDLLATGGTARATAALARKAGAEIAGLAFLVELEFLKGREKLQDFSVFSLVKY
jgi:adenine phosphoribosyltransferase